MNREPSVIGDWIGSRYDMGGGRTEWRLSMFRNQAYERQMIASQSHRLELALPESPLRRVTERGTWSLELVDPSRVLAELAARKRIPVPSESLEEFFVLRLTPSDGNQSVWAIHEVTRLGRCATLLVLRESILASRNLPILLYRIYLSAIESPETYDASGFPTQ
jgi:hypothetical protein